MIILEGPDGTGKSTLAAALSSRFNIGHIQIGGNPGPLDQVLQYCEECLLRVTDPVIQDRVTPISEYVYSQIFPRPYLVKPVQQFLREYYIQSIIELNPIIVYCRVEDLTKVTHTPSDSIIDVPSYLKAVTLNLSNLRQAYDKLFWKRAFESPRFLTYDCLTTDMEIVYEHVSKNLQ